MLNLVEHKIFFTALRSGILINGGFIRALPSSSTSMLVTGLQLKFIHSLCMQVANAVYTITLAL